MDIGFLVFGLAGLLTLVCFMPPLAGRLGLPYSVLLAIVGCLLGIGIHLHGWAPPVLGDLLDTIERFEISSETFLMVFLPVLLFETALSMNVRRLMNDIGPILMMAIVAVVVCTLVVGVAVNAVSSYGLLVCLLLGAIVATTDPAAVVGIFREVGAPKRLTTWSRARACSMTRLPSRCIRCCWLRWAARASFRPGPCSMTSSSTSWAGASPAG